MMNCPHCNFAMPERLDLAGQAFSCPKCNGPFMVPLPMAVASPQNTKQRGGCLGTGCLAVVALIAVIVVATMFSQGPGVPSRSTRSPEQVAKAESLCREMISSGVFAKIEKPGTTPRAWTGPQWSAMDFADKQAAMGIVAVAHSSDGMSRLYDNSTGKDIGTFANGQLKLK